MRPFVFCLLLFALPPAVFADVIRTPSGAQCYWRTLAKYFADGASFIESSDLDGKLTPELFTNSSFRLWSMVYAQQPRAGYPITFLADGKLISKNLATVKSWRIGGNNNLELLNAQNKAVYDFRYSLPCRVLVHESKIGDVPVTIEIGLEPSYSAPTKVDTRQG